MDQWTIDRPSTINHHISHRHQRPTIQRPSAIDHPSTINHRPSPTDHLPSTTDHPSTINIGHRASTIDRPWTMERPSMDHPWTIDRPSMDHRSSTTIHRLSTIGHQPPTIHRPSTNLNGFFLKKSRLIQREFIGKRTCSTRCCSPCTPSKSMSRTRCHFRRTTMQPRSPLEGS